MRYLTFLDSRQSTGTNPATCNYNLNQTILGGTQVRVLSFTYANTLHNVISGLNSLVFNTVTITVEPGFYTFADFITNINDQLMADAGFAANLGANPAAVTLSAQNTALWTIGTNGLLGGGLYPTFLLQSGDNYTGDFETSIFLAAPMAVALTCPALQGPDRFITSYPVQISSPFYVQHVSSAFGEMEPSAPSLQAQYASPLGQTSINTMQIQLTDPATGRVLTEVSQWSILLEISARAH
jgi:hypothetical protein